MFPCDWCGTPIDHYAAHFADPRFSGCREAALRPAPSLEILDGGQPTDRGARAQAERNRIRNAARRRQDRTNRADRIEALARSTVRHQDAHHEHRMRSLTQPPG